MADVFEKRLHGHFTAPQRLLVYANGYHMLLRDLQAKVVWNDILCWLDCPTATFPSVREKRASEVTADQDIVAMLHTPSAS